MFVRQPISFALPTVSNRLFLLASGTAVRDIVKRGLNHDASRYRIVSFNHAGVFPHTGIDLQYPYLGIRLSGSEQPDHMQISPPIAKPVGIPAASVSNDRLVLFFARSVGFFPVDSPSNGALVMLPSTLCQR